MYIIIDHENLFARSFTHIIFNWSMIITIVVSDGKGSPKSNIHKKSYLSK